MFVKVSLDYEWYGMHKDEAVVGPFDYQAASKWQAGFQLLMLKRKLTGEVVLLNETNVTPRFPPDKTPEEVYTKMYEDLYKFCMG